MNLPRAGDRSAIDPAAMGQTLGDAGRYPLEGRHVCPFCGAVNETLEGPCPQCTMTNTAETRKATKSRIGPWYVLQSRNPAAPGMRYDTLLGFVRKGRVRARSIVRGPTTHQLWRFACQVKGLSREFGLCYSCGGSIERDAQLCPQCNRLQDPPVDPDVFLEGQPAQPAAAEGGAPGTAPAAPAARGVSPGQVLQEVRHGPIFKELKLPPLTELPSVAAAVPASAGPAPVVSAPVVPAPAPQPAAAASPAPVPIPANRPPTPPVPPTMTPLAPLPPIPPVVPPPQPAAAPPAAAVAPSAAAAFQPAPVTPSPVAPAPAGPARPALTPADAAPKRNASDVFLSARDLAAAFQLGFDGEPDDRGKSAPILGGAAPWGAGDEVRAARPVYRRRKKRRIGRTIVLVVLFSVVGAAAFLLLNAPARQRVVEWAQAKYMGLTGADLYPDLVKTGSATRTPVPKARAMPSAGGSSPGVGATSGRPTVVTAAPVGDVRPAPATQASARSQTAQSRTARSVSGAGINEEDTASDVGPLTNADHASVAPAPTQRPLRQAPATVPVPPRIQERSEVTQSGPSPSQGSASAASATQPAPRAEVASATQPAAEPRRLTHEQAQQKSRDLYNQALDAEERGDFRQAKALYEQIMTTLPRDVWYQGIEARLRVAKSVLGEK